jgi:hypothetical protein
MGTMDNADVVLDPIHHVPMDPDLSAACLAKRLMDVVGMRLFVGPGRQSFAVTAMGVVRPPFALYANSRGKNP